MTQRNTFIEFVESYGDDPVGFVQHVLQAKPQPWQEQFLRKIASGERRISVRAGHGVGKVQAYDSVVPTPSGLRRWGDLQVGDLLFGRDGRPTMILATYPQKKMRFYRVTFDDGSVAEVGGPHLWNVRGRSERRKGEAGWRTLTTEEILGLGVRRPNGRGESRQWEIPAQGMVQFTSREVPLHPYFVGIWLGDGTKGEPQYTKPHAEVADALRAFGYEVSEHSAAGRYRVIGVSHLFRDEPFSLNSYDRFIPEDYKFNSVENRLSLFGGLMDSDGEVHRSGSIGYSSTSKRLADDVLWLARSLGCKAKYQAAVKKPSYINSDGVRVAGRDCYRLTINAPFNPFSIPHKRDAYKPSEHRYTVRWIDSIEPIDEQEGMCVTVSAPDHLYLMDDFIVTHNSTACSWALIWHMSCRYPQKSIVTAPTASQLYDALFAELKSWMNKLPPVLKDSFEVFSDKITFKAAPESSFISARTSSAERPEALAGVHSEHVLLVVDEASAVPEAVFEAAAGSMSGHSATTILISNPTRNSGLFYKTHHELASDWNRMHVSCIDNPLVAADFVRQIKMTYGEDSNAFRIRVLGEFALADDDTLIPADLVDGAIERDVVVPQNEPMIYGVDVARYGTDRTALCKRRGNVVIEIKSWGGLDLMQTVGVIVNEAKLDGPEEICVDTIGLGSGVADRLRELGFNVRDVNVSESSAMNPNAHRLRDELWMSVKEWLATRAVKLPKDEELRHELVAPRYMFMSNGKLVVESKDSMRKRRMRSPDKADSVCLTFAGNAAMVGGRSLAWKPGKPLSRGIRGIV